MPILIVGAFLILFGIFAIFSVSIFESFELTLLKFDEPSNYFYFFRQIIHILLAFFVWFVVYFIPLDFIKKNKGKIFLASLLLLLLVFSPLGLELNWARWWLYIQWLWTIQPWEFVKLTFVIFFSGWLLKKNKILPTLEWFIAMIVVVAICLWIFIFIPDFWTLLVLLPVSLILYYYAWGNLKYIWVGLILWFLFLFTIWMKFDYIKKRIDFFIHPEVDKRVQWIWYQTRQWLIAIWAWWFFWKWYWKWLQKFWFIPESQSDFIFAAFSEEIWFLWNTILLFLYFLLVYLSIKRMAFLKDPYEKNLAIWILALIIWQVFINIGVNVKLIPLTGLTLPFVSYGGTSIIVNIIELILLYKLLYKR